MAVTHGSDRHGNTRRPPSQRLRYGRTRQSPRPSAPADGERPATGLGGVPGYEAAAEARALNPAYCWVRAARLMTWADVGQMERHGLRRGNPEEFSNCDPDRRHLNQFGSDLPGADPTAVGANLKRMTQEASARRRQDAAVAAHLLLLASGSFFRPNDVADIGNEDPERVTAFRDAALDAVRERFGPIPAWRMDLDEATPAIDVFLVPLVFRQRKSGEGQYVVSYRDVFGGSKRNLSRLQDWFADEMAPLGLVRGIPVEETGATRVPLHTQYKLLARDRAIAATARVECERVLQQAREADAEARADRSRAASEIEQAEKVHAVAAQALRGAKQREHEAAGVLLTAQSRASEAARLEAAAQAVVAQGRINQAEAEKAQAAAEALLRDAQSDRASAAEALRGVQRRERAAEEARQAAASAAAAAASREADARAAQAQAQGALAEAERFKAAAAKAASQAQGSFRSAEEGRQLALAARTAAEADRREAATTKRRAEEAQKDAVADQSAAAARRQEAQGLANQAEADRRATAAQFVAAKTDRLAARKLAEALSGELDQVRQTALKEATSIINPLIEFRNTLRHETDRILEQARGWPPEVRTATAPVLKALIAIAGTRMHEVLEPLAPAGRNASADTLIGSVDAAVSKRLATLTPTHAATMRPHLTPISEAALVPHHRPPGSRETLAQRGAATPAAQTNTSKTEPT